MVCEIDQTVGTDMVFKYCKHDATYNFLEKSCNEMQ